MVSRLAYTPKYAEFFCGGGMVRAALTGHWDCVLANDIDPMKCQTYVDNWGKSALIEGDIANISPQPLKQPIDLYWASSPCQDFSLAGKGLGLVGEKSSVFTTWISKIKPVVRAGYAPAIIAFENVVGLLSRRNGQDFRHVLHQIIDLGYRVGALEIDAKAFLPQSRPRLFVIAVKTGLDISGLTRPGPVPIFHSQKIQKFWRGADEKIQKNWLWWDHPRPLAQTRSLEDILDDAPDTAWYSADQMAKLVDMMSAQSLQKLSEARASPGPSIATLYKRGRPDGQGRVRQRAELRCDGVAGCLRTPGGGSSRQTLVLVDGGTVTARLLSSREVARLMGLDDTYRMPARYNNAYKVAGDGVAVPVVAYLDETLFRPILAANAAKSKVA